MANLGNSWAVPAVHWVTHELWRLSGG